MPSPRAKQRGTGKCVPRSPGSGSTGPCRIYCWLNADEQLLPGALVRVAEEFRLHPEADVVFGDYLLLDAEGRPTAARREIPANAWLLRNGVNSILSCATFFRAEVWEALGGFDPSFSLVADKDFYLRALAAGFRFRHVRAYLGAYANTGDNASVRDPIRARREQARLRAKVGAQPAPIRRIARTIRCASKLLNGCYGAKMVSLFLFDYEGQTRDFRLRLGTKWESVPSFSRRKIRPSLSRRIAFAGLGTLAVLVRLLRTRRSQTRDATRPRVCILEPYGLGDAIALQPLVRAFCEAGSEVRVGTRSAWFPVFPPHPNLHLFESVPPWAARNDGEKYRNLRERMRPFLQALRAEAEGAVCIDPRGDVRSILAFYLAGGARVETLTHYYTANDCLVMPGAAHRHAILRTVPRWRLNGVFAPDLDLLPPDLRFLRKPENPKTRKPGKPTVALIPMTPWIGKRWFVERWKAVLEGLEQRSLSPIVLCGPGEEYEAMQNFCPGVNIQVCPDIRAWADALSDVKAAISVNTGPMHLASALGIPVVLLEGSSRQPLWQPPCGPFAVVSHQSEVPCAPCHQVGDCRCCNRKCMALIRPDEVLSALDGLLSARQGVIL